MRLSTASVFAVFALAACSSSERASTDSAVSHVDDVVSAQSGGVTFSVSDSAGAELGILTVSESASGLTVTGTLRGLPPGTHGVHFHETGICEAPFASAGGHWNPAGKQHGTLNPNGPHAGDLGNIEVATDGTVVLQLTSVSNVLRGDGGLIDADGAALIVHATADDNMTDPAGNAGPRIACGRIG